jgi:hypothetical protein
MALLNQVEVLFSNVLSVDDFSDKYQIVVKLTEEQAADAEEAGLNVKTKEYNGATQFVATFKTKFKPRIVGNVANKDLDLEGSEIGRGSKVNVQYKFRDWVAPGGKTGTGQDLIATQVLSLSAPNDMEFEDANEFGGDEENTDY